MRSLRLLLFCFLFANTAWANKQALSDSKQRGGFHYISDELKALQNSPSDNPALLWVKAGEQQFKQQCINCHTPTSMNSVAALYPQWSQSSKRVINLAGRINQCRTDHLKLQPLPRENQQLLQLEAFIAMQAKGAVVTAGTSNDATKTLRTLGEKIWAQPLGQLGISCAQCHDDRAGKKLAASIIPEGHANAYPVYRLQWQSIGSLDRRIRGCQTGVRATPFEYSSEELLALEMYLKERAVGLVHEGVGVRP